MTSSHNAQQRAEYWAMKRKRQNPERIMTDVQLFDDVKAMLGKASIELRKSKKEDRRKLNITRHDAWRAAKNSKRKGTRKGNPRWLNIGCTKGRG